MPGTIEVDTSNLKYAKVLMHAGMNATRSGEFQVALRCFEDALGRLRRGNFKDDADVASAWVSALQDKLHLSLAR